MVASGRWSAKREELTSNASVCLVGGLAQQGVAENDGVFARLCRVDNSWGSHGGHGSVAQSQSWRSISGLCGELMLEGQGIVWAGNQRAKELAGVF